VAPAIAFMSGGQLVADRALEAGAADAAGAALEAGAADAGAVGAADAGADAVLAELAPAEWAGAGCFSLE